MMHIVIPPYFGVHLQALTTPIDYHPFVTPTDNWIVIVVYDKVVDSGSTSTTSMLMASVEPFMIA